MATIRAMTAADISFGMRLKEAAGWNQVEADWRRALALAADGVFVAEVSDQPVGCVVALAFGQVGWVAMMLVDAAYRGQGLGRALMERALATLDRAGVASVRLDATALGRPLYEKLGFVAEYEVLRFAGAPAAARARSRSLDLREMKDGDRDAVAALDLAATKTDRGRWLALMANDADCDTRIAESNGRVDGYLLSRPGSRARFIGPCVARGEAGRGLIEEAFTRHAGEPIYLDVPAWHVAALEVANDWGLAESRRFKRMGRGPRVDDQSPLLWASAGPEFG